MFGWSVACLSVCVSTLSSQAALQCPGIHPLDGILSAGEYLCPDSYRHIEMSCC